MPRRSEDELEQIYNRFVGIISERQKGISRSKLQDVYKEKYGQKLPVRSVIRWLNHLDEVNRIKIEGGKKDRRYFPVEDVKTKRKETEKLVSIQSLVSKNSSENSLKLSAQGEDIRNKVQRPKSEREPIGYNQEFLARYKPGSTWYLPPEVREELQQLGKTPEQNRPAGTYAKKILEPLLIDLSWSSSRLEGNTYSRAETRELIQEGKEAAGKDPREAQMILNHKSAIEFLVENIEEIDFNKPTILTIHAALSENLMGDPSKEGSLRDGQVGIGKSTYTPKSVPQEIERCFQQMLDQARNISDPFEQAFFIMVHLPYLQPFWDINKRTSRLAANIPLFQLNYSPLSFVDVPRDLYIEALLGVYELNRYELLRDVFVWAYKRSCKQYRVIKDSVEQPDPIRLKYRDQLEELIRTIVLENKPPSAQVVEEIGSELEIPEKDFEQFTHKTLELLENFNQGKAGRYKINVAKFKNWRNQFSDYL
ncbi:MAG: Fic family protein [bacterium]